MPHTSHRKKPQRHKRAEIVNEDGWTQITSKNSLQRQPHPPRDAKDVITGMYENLEETATIEYPPVEVPADSTITKLQEQYERHEKIWLESTSFRALDKCLRNDVDVGVLKNIDTCFIFGSGTFSGLYRGWIDRSHVAMVQLAVFMSVVDIIVSITGNRPLLNAQEPIYTSLDRDFLQQRGVVVLATPVGFEALTSRSFVYCPGAELEVELRTVSCDPAMAMFNSKLDRYWRNERGEACTDSILVAIDVDTSARNAKTGKSGDIENKSEGLEETKPLHEYTHDERREYYRAEDLQREIEAGLQICEKFRRDKEWQKLPTLDARDEPFYGVYLFYRKAQNSIDDDVSA